jgi:surfeit locus 1 family protein
MRQKQALRAAIDAAAAAPAIALPGQVSDWSAWRFRTVEVRGVFDARAQILIDNRIHEGRAGYHVVTPLALDDGRIVLVNRGWIPGGRSRGELPAVPPPAGEVTVRGQIALPSRAYLELRREAAAGPVWQNLDLARYRDATRPAVQDVVVLQSPQGAPSDGLVRDWPMPDTGIATHRIYMVQWYLFAAMVAALWFWFALRPALVRRSP